MLSFIKQLFAAKEPVKIKPDYYDIVCPYCFSKFHPEQVVFRATHSRDDDDDYALQEDDLLNQYRVKFNLSPIDEIEAVIRPETIPDEYKQYVGKTLVSITDRYGKMSRRRLCPECHNELPITSGKAPSNIISIIGASQVGKSVYMTTLIHTLQQTTAANFNAACMPLNADISRKFSEQYETPLFENGYMLESTQREVQQEPFIFQFISKDDRFDPLMLVFFDVAGEGMIDKQYLDIKAAHIKNSSGVLFLVDPLQIRSIRDKLIFNMGEDAGEFAARYDEPREVILSLFENFIGYEETSRTNIPTAVVLTKSDMLKYLSEEGGEYIKPNSNVFNNFEHRGYLNMTQFENINGEIGRFIGKVDRPFKDALEVNFTDTAYFAVSALGSNPSDKKIQGIISPIRVDEPFLWLLYKFNYIQGSEAN